MTTDAPSDENNAPRLQEQPEAPISPVEVAAPEQAGIPCDASPLTTRIEALLISTDRPLTEARLSAVLALPGKGTAARVREAINELNAGYDREDRSFRIQRLAGGWQILTQSDYWPLLTRLHADRQQTRLSQAALETMAIIAYRQPIMRAEIEAIRGVACGEVLRGLLDRRLVKIVGRAEELGRPMLYGTTKTFLTVFGLSGVDDLPVVDGAMRPAVTTTAATPPAPRATDEPPPPEEESSDEPSPVDEVPERDDTGPVTGTEIPGPG